MRRGCGALALFALLSACAQMPITEQPEPIAEAAAPSPSQWQADVMAIAGEQDNAGRREAIKARLDTVGIQWQASAFATPNGPGENVLAHVSGGEHAPLLLLGAHSDRVEAGRGATDNASGSAVVLALAQRLRQRPLDNHRVAVAFWDLEERGLLGAQAYIADGGEKPALYVNFDVFGWGDTLWMMSPEPSHPLAESSSQAAAAAGLGLSVGTRYPPSDHLAFLQAQWPAVSYSLVGGEEIPLILSIFAGEKPVATPKVMSVIHSERDVVQEIDADAANRGVDAVEAALRSWDALQGSVARSGGNPP